MGGVWKCIADDDNDSGGFELSCEIIIHHIFLYFKHKIPLLWESHVFYVSYTHTREREKFSLRMP